MNVKAFAFDLDGTLLGTDHRINQENVDAILYAREKGIKIFICTGRPLFDTLKPLVDLEDNIIDYGILNNGAYEYNFSNKEIILNGEVDKSVIETFVKIGKKYKTIFAIHTFDKPIRGDFFNGQEPEWFAHAKKTEQYLSEERDNHVPIEKALEMVKDKKITQLSFRGTAQEIRDIEKELIELGIDKKVNLFDSSGVYMDFSPKGINKFVGLEKLAKKFDISIDEIVAFGDSGNDIEMLDKAGLGIAMGNASDQAKEIADIVIGNNDTNAIANKIREMV